MPVLILEGDRLHLRDAGSRNTSRVGGKPVKEAVLKNGDILQFGTVVFEVKKSANQFKDRRRLYNRGHPGLQSGSWLSHDRYKDLFS